MLRVPARLTALTVAGALALAIAAPVVAAEDGAHVRVLHGSPDAPSVDVYVNDAKVEALSGPEFGDLSGYVSVPGGTYAIKVCATADATVCPIDVAALEVADGVDPNQLPMVSQGVHPEGTSASALEHRVGATATVPPERGLFLDVTRRLHPAINAYISDTFYDGRLTAHPSTGRQHIDADDPVLGGSGVRWVPIEHAGNGPRSRQEAEVAAEMVRALLQRDWIDAKGDRHRVGIDDILVVAPYNAQVAEIQAALLRTIGQRGNVGTVDKFQGREGAVAIYSMASSSRDDAPRDMGFLYSRNRLNVAVSRARALHQVAALCSLVEHAAAD